MRHGSFGAVAANHSRALGITLLDNASALHASGLAGWLALQADSAAETSC